MTTAAPLAPPAQEPAPATVRDLVDALAAAGGSTDLARTAARGLQAVLHARVAVSSAGGFRAELCDVVASAMRLPRPLQPLQPVVPIQPSRSAGRAHAPASLLLAAGTRRRPTQYLLWRSAPFGPGELALADALAMAILTLHLRWEATEVQGHPGPTPVSSLSSQPSSPLTSRELFILEHLARGLSAEGIARVAGISPRTVRKHLQNVYAKLGAHDRLVAVEAARSLGLLGRGVAGGRP